jgi:hypothetical protein
MDTIVKWPRDEADQTRISREFTPSDFISHDRTQRIADASATADPDMRGLATA